MSKSPIQIVTLIYNPFDDQAHIAPCPIFPGVNKFSVALRSLFINRIIHNLDPAVDLGVNVSIGTVQCNNYIIAGASPAIFPSTIIDTIPLNSSTLVQVDAITYQNPDCYNSRVLFTIGDSPSLSLGTVATQLDLYGDYCQATLCFYEEPDSFSNFSVGQY
jgi:hypothetical protein